MDDELCLKYLIDHFDRHTTPLEGPGGPGACPLAPIDRGWTQRYKVIDAALKRRIQPYCLPPHSTYIMQPLDVACFGPLQRAYRTALQDWVYKNTGEWLSKPIFWELLSQVRKEALTSSNILAGFESTGIYPLCPERVLGKTRIVTSGTISSASESSQTPHKMAQLRKGVQELDLTPQTRNTVEE